MGAVGYLYELYNGSLVEYFVLGRIIQDAMKSNELRKLLKSAGLDQSEAARLLDVTDRTMRRYVSGSGDIPRSIEYAILYIVSKATQAVKQAAMYSDTGNSLAFVGSVSRRQQDSHLVLIGRHGGKKLFMSTIAETGARAHKHLYKQLSALLEHKS